MADEKLPEYVEEALNVFQDASVEKGGFMGPVGYDEAVRKMFISKVDLRAAIHRYAREREAAALERAAQVCDAKADVMEQNYRASINDEWIGFKTCYETAAERIRAMIHKEPANG